MTDTRDLETRAEARSDRRGDDRELLAYLQGELDARRLRTLCRRLEQEPALAERLRSLEGTWQALELPPVAPAPLGFAARVAARATEGRGGENAEAFRPAWVRLAGAAVLATGIAAGVGLGMLTADDRSSATVGTTVATEDDLTTTTVPTLAEAYWSAFGQELSDAEEVR